jgi:hypothetical protein
MQLSRYDEAAEEVLETRASAAVEASWLGMAYTSGHLVK